MACVVLIWLSVVGLAYSRPSGLPKVACDDLTPTHGSEAFFQAANGDRRYSLLPESRIFLPGDFMRIQVWDNENIGRPIRGACMQCRRTATDDVAGVWSQPGKDMRTMECRTSVDTLTHRRSTTKRDDEVSGVWTAPATCRKNEQFRINATIAQNSRSWHKASVPLVCDPDYSNVTVMERVRPPLKSQYCAQGSWALIPKNASESFEAPIGGRERWRHLNSAKELKFRRRRRPTPTEETGPTSAQHGEFYIYYEASGTSRGDMAGILSPGIQGCFCFSFYYHMNTDGATELALRIAGETVLSTVEVTNFWRRVLYTVISEEPVVFTLQVFSSGGEKGDVGIDNIEVIPGPCDNTTNGFAGEVDI